MERPPEIAWSSDRTLRLAFGSAPSLARAYAALRSRPPEGVIEFIPAAETLTIAFDVLALAARPDGHALAEEAVRAAVEAAREGTNTRASGGVPRLVEIPACAEGEDFAPDLAFVAERCGLSRDEVLRRYAVAEYRVEFLGFAPGFAYLAGLPPELASPRLDTPRPRVAPGSVGIAGTQTGVYPLSTPGGWRIIARSPIRLFDPRRDEPALLRFGDRVRFVLISRSAFDAWPERGSGA